MTVNIAVPPPTVAVASTGRATRLLRGGAVAGPLYVVVALIQVLTRDGFDIRRHPLSLLSLGDLGWIQIANFVIAGLLFLAAATGMRRAMHLGSGRTWGPILIGAFGASLVWGGLFLADPAGGFPSGIPEATGTPSWHGLLHSIAPALGFLALTGACFVFARRFASRRQWGWAAYSGATGLALLTPDLLFNHPWFTAVLAIAAALGCIWASAVAARLAADLDR